MAEKVTFKEILPDDPEVRLSRAYYALKSLKPENAAPYLEEIINKQDWLFYGYDSFVELLDDKYHIAISEIASIFFGVSELIMNEIPKQRTLSDAGKLGGRGNKASNNVTSFRGNNPSYKIARLKRDRPELAEKVISGELTPNAAFIEAGFANKKMTVPLIKEKVVGWILKYFNEDDIEYIKNNL